MLHTRIHSIFDFLDCFLSVRTPSTPLVVKVSVDVSRPNFCVWRVHVESGPVIKHVRSKYQQSECTLLGDFNDIELLKYLLTVFITTCWNAKFDEKFIQRSHKNLLKRSHYWKCWLPSRKWIWEIKSRLTGFNSDLETIFCTETYLYQSNSLYRAHLYAPNLQKLKVWRRFRVNKSNTSN